MLILQTLGALCFGALVNAAKEPPSSWPKNYTGIPRGDYSTQWQQYFRVKEPLPGIDFDLGNNYAGNILVQRPNHRNDSLFFWGFEKEDGSLTAAAGERDTEPWAIWLQGGPGSSSLYGLLTENGPISLIPNKHQFTQNNYSWSNLVDYIWVDQPVGVGFATADSEGYVKDQDQIGTDFVRFLKNLVKVFPSLANRPFYLTGESYAGRYIPYIVKALFSAPNPPVSLAKMVVGDPAFGSNAEFKTMPALHLIETYPQLIGYDTEVYEYFKTQTHLCGLDLNLSYPQTGGTFPTIHLAAGEDPETILKSQDESSFEHNDDLLHGKTGAGSFVSEVSVQYALRIAKGESLLQDEKRKKRDVWKANLSDRADGEIDPWYGCYIWQEMVDYAVNFTYPWTPAAGEFDNFDVPSALKPKANTNLSFFLNNPTVQAALHAPDKTWVKTTDYPWGSKTNGKDHSPEPMVFFTELATNATKDGVHIIIYVGNDDGISPHFGTEVTIQNTTFGGIQGFTRRPSTPWFDDNGNWAGIVHQERNWTYALIYGAGHEVPTTQPVAAYTFFREFVLGDNPTGRVKSDGGIVVVIGGENPTLNQTAIPGQLGIAYGSRSTEGLYTFPSATIAAWESYVSFVPITGTDAIQPTSTSGSTGEASSPRFSGDAQNIVG